MKNQLKVLQELNELNTDCCVSGSVCNLFSPTFDVNTTSKIASSFTLKQNREQSLRVHDNPLAQCGLV